MKKATGICAGVLAALGAASAGVPDSTALDRFDSTGETVACISARSFDIKAVDESTFLFKVGVGDFYVNRTRNACNGATSRFVRIDVILFGSQLCSGEILKVVEQRSGIFQGSCSLGDFEKLNKKPAE